MFSTMQIGFGNKQKHISYEHLMLFMMFLKWVYEIKIVSNDAHGLTPSLFIIGC